MQIKETFIWRSPNCGESNLNPLKRNLDKTELNAFDYNDLREEDPQKKLKIKDRLKKSEPLNHHLMPKTSAGLPEKVNKVTVGAEDLQREGDLSKNLHSSAIEREFKLNENLQKLNKNFKDQTLNSSFS
jgi:hypothetical protein